MQAWLFPGQGAQRTGMGLDLFDRFPQYTDIASRILGYSIVDLCAGKIADGLRRTEYVQPALFVVEALSFLARRETNAPPDYVAGHSVGELAALWAAGCVDFETALTLVRRRGELMGQANGGAMAAIVGLDADRLTGLLGEIGAHDIDIANLNAPDQTVLSGPRSSLDGVASPVRAAGGRYVPLNVSAAFHSRYMRTAADAFAVDLAKVTFSPPRIPVVANVTAAIYPDNAIASLLAQQITAPVRWRDSMRTLNTLGVRDVSDIGPWNVLTNLWTACAADRAGRPDRTVPNPAPATPPAPAGAASPAKPAALGSARFCEDFGIRHAYLAGSMYHGIASTDLVIAMAKAGLMGFFGTGGLSLADIEAAIGRLHAALGESGPFGMNLLHDLNRPEREERTVDLFLRTGIRCVEAAAYTTITPALVRFRFHGAHRDAQGAPIVPQRVLAKVSRPEVAQAFMSPPPKDIVERLVASGGLTPREADVCVEHPISEDICVEADSAGHTDGGVALTLVPAFTRLRDQIACGYSRTVDIRLGASGGLGAPEAIAAVFVLGADFVMTGSINQCTVEAGTSALVKDMLCDIDVQDTTYAPAGDMFELGARVQVVRRGTLFAARANKLYQLYRSHDGIEQLDQRTRNTIASYFGCPLDDVWDRLRQRYLDTGRLTELSNLEAQPKQRMAQVFRRYFTDSTQAAIAGNSADKVNFQVHCGPAMGSFNRFAATTMPHWHDRHVADIAETLMSAAAEVLDRHSTGRHRLTGTTSSPSTP